MQRNLYRLNRESFKLAAGGICCHVHNKDCGTNHWHLLVTLWLAVKLTGLLASLDTTKTTPLVQISRQLHPIFSLHSIANRLKGPNEVFWHISKSILTKQFGLSQKNSKKKCEKIELSRLKLCQKFELSRLNLCQKIRVEPARPRARKRKNLILKIKTDFRKMEFSNLF